MYIRKPVVKLSGSENFKNTHTKLFTVLDFWQYGFSSLSSNVLRGALAEFLVENALKEGTELDVRNPWGDSDVEYGGKTIEVKSCSYLQDWNQPKLTTVQWSGLKAKKLYWSSAVNGVVDKDEKREYKSDIYVLALLDHKETDTLDILDLNQWCFFVLSRDALRTVSEDRSAISLARLRKNNIHPVSFDGLRAAIDAF